MPQVRRVKIANLWNAKLLGSVGKSCYLHHALDHARREALYWHCPIEMLRLFHRHPCDWQHLCLRHRQCGERLLPLVQGLYRRLGLGM
jgi:hypothetical protein